MANTNLQILTPSDILILDIFAGLVEKFQFADPSFHIAGSNSPLTDFGKIRPLAEHDFGYIRSVSTNKNSNNISLLINTTITNNVNGHQVQVPHPYLSLLIFQNSGSDYSSDSDMRGAFAFVMAKLKANKLLPTLPSEGLNELSFQKTVLTAIQASASDQILRTNDFFRDLQVKFNDKLQALEIQHRDKELELAEKSAKREEELNKRSEALETLRVSLDDRNNTHARRAVRGELIETIKARQTNFDIPTTVTDLRWPIHAVFILMMSSLFLGAAWSLYVWGTSQAPEWNAAFVSITLKTIIFSLGFVTIAGLYITWMNRWLDKNVEAQFQVRQFELDINRATWAVEAALEWKSNEGQEMPKELLTGITNHLFEKSNSDSVEYSPLEMLASSILGSASNLKLNLGAGEMSLDRRSLKQIEKGGK